MTVNFCIQCCSLNEKIFPLTKTSEMQRRQYVILNYRVSLIPIVIFPCNDQNIKQDLKTLSPMLAPKLLRLLRQSVVCLHLITIYVSCLFAFVYNLSELFVCICLQFKVSCLFAFVYNFCQLFVCFCLQFKSAVYLHLFTI